MPKKSGGKEFILVVLIAIAGLGTGGLHAEESIPAGTASEPVALTARSATSPPEIEAEIRRELSAHLALAGTLVLNSEPAGAEWTLEDNSGHKRTGATPAEIPDMAGGEVTVILRRPNWSDRTRKIAVDVARGTTWTEHYADQGRSPDWLFKAESSELQKAADDGWAAAKLELGDRSLCGVNGRIDYEQARSWYEAAHADSERGYGTRLYLLSSRTGIAPHSIEQVHKWLWDDAQAGDPLSVLLWLQHRITQPTAESVPPDAVATAVQKALAQCEAGDRLIPLALCIYFEGVAKPRDFAQAHLLARSALQAGNLQALPWLSSKAEKLDLKDAKGQPEALALMTRAAEANDTEAMRKIGNWHFDGKYSPQNPPEAFRWWRMGADAGNAWCQTLVGAAYRDGIGVTPDPATAIIWWRKAAEIHPSAMGELGRAYLQGRDGVQTDYAQAISWLQRAAALNDYFAAAHLAHAYTAGYGVPQSDAEAFVWWRKAAAVIPEAMYRVGLAYFDGKGVPQNREEGVAWWRRAAAQDHVEATCELASAFFEGVGVTQDDIQAVTLWRRAAASDHPTALYNLGWAINNGRGAEKNPEKAIEFWKRAARLGHEESQNALRDLNVTWQ